MDIGRGGKCGKPDINGGIDGIHIKASGNVNRKIRREVPAAAKRYRVELLSEINTGWETHGKNLNNDDNRTKLGGRNETTPQKRGRPGGRKGKKAKTSSDVHHRSRVRNDSQRRA